MSAPVNVPPFHMIATDMDGTLLSPQHVITPFTKSTLQAAVAKYPHQLFVVLASGRHFRDLESYLESLDLPECCGYLVSCNGARVHRVHYATNAGGQKEKSLVPVMSTSMPTDQVRRLLCYFSRTEKEINITMYQRDEWLSALDWVDELQYTASTGFKYRLFDPESLVAAFDAYTAAHPAPSNGGDDPDPQNPLGGIGKLFFGSDNTERIAALRAQIRADMPDLVITASSKYTCEITAAGVTKAAGLTALLPILQKHTQDALALREGGDSEPWTLRTCIAFGDGDNDIQMLEAAGKGCIMANCDPVLTQRFPDLEVVAPNSEDGVAKKVREVFLSS